MNVALLIAGVLAVVTGISHSYLGERDIIIPLTHRDDLPRMPALRAVWHFFTLVMLTLAGVLFAFALNGVEGGAQVAVRITAVYAAIFAVAVLARSRGRHFAWVLGSGIAVAAWWGTV